MAQDLTKLFGSVQDPSSEATPFDSSEPHPSGKSTGGMVASTITATTFSTSTTPGEPVVTRVLYFSTEADTKYCLGLIGDKKFCCSTKCEVMKHASLKFNPETGLFIRVPRKQDQCFNSPFLPDEFLEPSLLELFLSEEKTVEEWNAIFAQVLANSEKLSESDWFSIQSLRSRAKAFRTPAKKANIKSELMDRLTSLVDDLEDLKGTIEESQTGEIDPIQTRLSVLEVQVKLIGSRLQAWVKGQSEHMKEIQENVDSINSRLIDVESMLGDFPSSDTSRIEPTIWGSIASLANKQEPQDPFTSTIWMRSTKEFKNLETLYLTDKKSALGFKAALIKLCEQFKSDITHLDKQIKIAKSEINTKMQPADTSHLFGSIQDSSVSEMEILNQNYQTVLGQLDHLNNSVKSLATTSHDGTPDGVEIGDLRFPSRPDLTVWVEDNLKSLNFPFGVFLDVYSFLARIQSGFTLEDPAQSMLKNLDLNHRVHLTSDETTTLSSFMYMVPPILGKAGSGNSAISSTKNTFLPALREKEDWQNSTRNGGVKHIIEDQMPNVIYQMKDLIGTRLHGNSQAIMLATTCLSISHTFVVELARFISDTHRDLELAGFPTKSSWLLVTKLVVRIFGTDLDKVRSFMRGKMDTETHVILATDALWATLRTIGVMQDYMRHGIENHPAIAAEYVRFLVANSGLGTMDRLTTSLKTLTTKVDDAVAKAKAAQSAATTATNKAFEAIEIAKKK